MLQRLLAAAWDAGALVVALGDHNADLCDNAALWSSYARSGAGKAVTSEESAPVHGGHGVPLRVPFTPEVGAKGGGGEAGGEGENGVWERFAELAVRAEPGLEEGGQGLTLVHLSAQHEHLLRDMSVGVGWFQ